MLISEAEFPKTETAVVAGSMLARAGLRSLLEKYVYRVLCTAETVEKLLQPPLSDRPKLVLIAPDSLDDLTTQASACRQHWSDSRIVAIYDCFDAGDDERVRASSANGCVSTKVSERSLLSLLDLLVRDEEDLFFMLQLRSGAVPPAKKLGPLQSEILHISNDGGLSGAPNANAEPSLKRNGATYIHEGQVPIAPAESRPRRNVPKLSERELQVLDGIVRGLQNKMIARTYGITEATVKVHMKSILRKIQVQNRTQAAVWAMGHDASICSALEQRLFVSEPDAACRED